jgi:hypothetical protein
MKAFFGKQEVKDKYVNRVKGYREMDNLIQGTGWEEGKGCAVGCTLENYDHAQYEIELGIPEWLARLEDTIFEGLPKAEAMLWPEKFLSAINVGADLEKVKVPFLIHILEKNILTLDALPDMSAYPDVANAIALSRAANVEMIRCRREGLHLSAAESAARSAAESAARSAAWSARSAAESAAWSARSAAESAAWSAWSAAWSAAESAWSAAESAARSAAYLYFANKLIEILEDTK